MITLPGDSANAKTMQVSTVPVFSNLIEAAALCVRPRSKRGNQFVAAVLAGLRSALVRAGWEESSRVATLRMAMVLLPWFAAALALSSAGFFRGAADRIPTIEFGIFVPIVIALVCHCSWPKSAGQRKPNLKANKVTRVFVSLLTVW